MHNKWSMPNREMETKPFEWLHGYKNIHNLYVFQQFSILFTTFLCMKSFPKIEEKIEIAPSLPWRTILLGVEPEWESNLWISHLGSGEYQIILLVLCQLAGKWLRIGENYLKCGSSSPDKICNINMEKESLFFVRKTSWILSKCQIF